MSKNQKQTEMSTKVSSEIIFSDNQARDVFNTIMEEYSENLIQAINQLSVSKGYGPADAKIELVGDAIHIDMKNKSKGLVLTKDGFVDYKDVPVNSRYMEVKQGKPAVSVKMAEDQVDTLIGYAPDMTQVRLALDEEINVKSIIEKTS
jgi:hypothetical protein